MAVAGTLTLEKRPAAKEAAASRASRLTSIDVVRGLVIAFMVLDHVREFFFDPVGPVPTDLAHSNPALFATRWITHLCAPTFILLAGVSVWLQESRGKSKRDLTLFLVKRGLWLLFLEVTFVGFGFDFGVQLLLQVIWVIGAGFLALAVAIWLPRPAVAALALVIIGGHDALGPLRPHEPGLLKALWTLALEPGRIGVLPGYVSYPALPWFGVLCLGYVIGPVFSMTPGRRQTLLWIGAAAAAAAFALLRGVNGYGDPQPWSVQADPLMTVASFFNVTKYPPSLDYLLITLSVAAAMLAVAERLKGPVSQVMLNFGRTPLFMYVLHIYVAHLLALAVGVAMGVPASAFLDYRVDPSRASAAGWGFGLGGVYLAWLATLVLIYPAAHWFAGVKGRRRDWWLSYL
jgi:uncharacterized membrane protein